MRYRLLLCLLLLANVGCMSVATRVGCCGGSQFFGSPYQGTAADCGLAVGAPFAGGPGLLIGAGALVDAPFSFAFDTLCLPGDLFVMVQSSREPAEVSD